MAARDPDPIPWRLIVNRRVAAVLPRANGYDPPKVDPWHARLIKYIPTDVVAVYLFLVAMLGGTLVNTPRAQIDVRIPKGCTENAFCFADLMAHLCSNTRLALVFWFGLVMAPLVRWLTIDPPAPARFTAGTMPWFQIAAAPVAFAAWAFGIGGVFFEVYGYTPQLGAAIIAVAAFLLTVADLLLDKLLPKGPG